MGWSTDGACQSYQFDIVVITFQPYHQWSTMVYIAIKAIESKQNMYIYTP